MGFLILEKIFIHWEETYVILLLDIDFELDKNWHQCGISMKMQKCVYTSME